MLDVHKNIESALKDILPTYYELICDSKTTKPCITYNEYMNNIDIGSDVVGYSNVGFYIKIWANSIATIQQKAPLIDNAMRQLGYRRASSNELSVDGQIEKIMAYEAIGFEKYNNGD